MGVPSPPLALVLGSGLGDFADRIPHPQVIETSDIPHYPRSSVPGHRGRLVFGTLFGVTLLTFQGRVHFYESDDVEAVLYPIRVAASLGAKYLILTNAAGGIRRSFRPGDLMLISDIINLTFEATPFKGFPDLSVERPLFDPQLRALIRNTARQLGFPLQEGIYAGVKGPSYETAAEVEMVHRLGGDAVGMSTVLEAHGALHLGLRVAAISCITNLATGITPAPLSHEEVTEVGNRVKETFGKLLEEVVREFGSIHLPET